MRLNPPFPDSRLTRCCGLFAAVEPLGADEVLVARAMSATNKTPIRAFFGDDDQGATDPLRIGSAARAMSHALERMLGLEPSNRPRA